MLSLQVVTHIGVFTIAYLNCLLGDCSCWGNVEEALKLEQCGLHGGERLAASCSALHIPAHQL